MIKSLSFFCVFPLLIKGNSHACPHNSCRAGTVGRDGLAGTAPDRQRVNGTVARAAHPKARSHLAG
jgi:hypothetical protein